MGSYHSNIGHSCSPGVKEVIFMVVGLILHAVALVRYCARFREATKQRCSSIDDSNIKMGVDGWGDASKNEGSY